MIQRIAITGSSGYYGRALVDLIRRISPDTRILGVDVASPPNSPHHGSTASHTLPAVAQGPDEFLKADITSDAVTQALNKFRPDTVVHLAFVVNPMRDERRMRQINVEGTRQLLQACRQIRPERVLIGSSATAYGAWDDNPVPMAESCRLKARSEYRYAADKVEVEGLLEDFRRENPSIRVAWTRPCMIYGPDSPTISPALSSKVRSSFCRVETIRSFSLSMSKMLRRPHGRSCRTMRKVLSTSRHRTGSI